MSDLPDSENTNIEALLAELNGDYRMSTAIELFGQISWVADLPEALVGKFTRTVDAAEASAILQACGQSEQCELLMIMFFEKSKGWNNTEEWKELIQKLIAYESRSFVDFYVKYSDSYGYGAVRYRRERFEKIRNFAFTQITQHIKVAEIERMMNCLLASKSPDDYLDELNILAKANWNDGRINPLLKLMQDKPQQLYEAISKWWVNQIDHCVDNRRNDGWGAALERTFSPNRPDVISYLAGHGGGFLLVPIGFLAGVHANTMHEIQEKIAEYSGGRNVQTFIAMAELWHTLKSINEFGAPYNDHEVELLGLRKLLMQSVNEHQEMWLQALPLMMRLAIKSHIKSDVVTATCELGKRAHGQLASLAAGKDHEVAALARGILAMMEGIEDPSRTHLTLLADTLAQYQDGTPKFPSPLSLRSATWISSVRFEDQLRNAVKACCLKFSAHVCDNHGSVEEAMTATLQQMLIDRLSAAGKPRAGTLSEFAGAPELKLLQREISKNVEESEYGCDLAFLVKASARDVYWMEWADLVQVKKSLVMSDADATELSSDSWSITIKQLNTLIGKSATAVYFLICAKGEILVVPARFLLGFVRGKKGSEKNLTRTLGYNDIRSAAISLEQYLIDLLIGQWLGSSSQDTLDFIGGNQKLKPRLVIEAVIEFAAPRG